MRRWIAALALAAAGCPGELNLDLGGTETEGSSGGGTTTSTVSTSTDVTTSETAGSVGSSGGVGSSAGPTTDTQTSGVDSSGTSTETCGNGMLDGTEECDGTRLDGEDCESQDFASGDLACAADCTFDTESCIPRGCGNGVVDGGEDCEAGMLGGTNCMDLDFDGGMLSCSPTCRFDTNLCFECGDGMVNPGESCDTKDLDDRTCATEAFDDGVLACGDDCEFDTSGCTVCGDGVLNGTEQCDAADLGDLECDDVGFFGGTLACDSSCNLNTDGCNDCGNMEIDAGEQCDVVLFETCESIGQGVGQLACNNATCIFDTDGCTNAPFCGDGFANGTEECDETSFSNFTVCSQLPMFGGPGLLECSGDCQLSVENCEFPYKSCSVGAGCSGGVGACGNDGLGSVCRPPCGVMIPCLPPPSVPGVLIPFVVSCVDGGCELQCTDDGECYPGQICDVGQNRCTWL